MKMTCAHFIILLAIAVLIMPVCADAGNTSNTTAIPTATETTLETTVTTQVTTEATTAAVDATTTTVLTTQTTATTETTVPTSTVNATTQITEVPVSLISVASSPLGAAIIIDGVYYGVTPGNVTGISPGTHMIRLSLSGYNDYEGTFYAVTGQNIPVYGTLHPISGAASQIILATAPTPATTAVPETTIQPLNTTQTSSGSAFENPTVIAAIIGIFTACIGAIATIFPHILKTKKE